MIPGSMALLYINRPIRMLHGPGNICTCRRVCTWTCVCAHVCTQTCMCMHGWAYRCGHILELYSEVVEFAGSEEDHVEHLYHVRGKGELLLSVKDLCQCAVHRVGPHIHTQLSAQGRNNNNNNNNRYCTTT